LRGQDRSRRSNVKPAQRGADEDTALHRVKLPQRRATSRRRTPEDTVENAAPRARSRRAAAFAISALALADESRAARTAIAWRCRTRARRSRSDQDPYGRRARSRPRVNRFDRLREHGRRGSRAAADARQIRCSGSNLDRCLPYDM
jgi:hypothetical protein